MGYERVPIGGHRNITEATLAVMTGPNIRREAGSRHLWTSRDILAEFLRRGWIKQNSRDRFRSPVTSALGNLEHKGRGVRSTGTRDGRYVIYEYTGKIDREVWDENPAPELVERIEEVKAKQPNPMKPAADSFDNDSVEWVVDPKVGDLWVGELFEVIAIMGKKVLLRREGSDSAWEAKVLR